MRYVSGVPLMLLLVFGMFLTQVPVGAGLARQATPSGTPAALAWGACPDGADGWECASLTVPLDDANPDGPTIDLAVTRLPAADPARRVGVLLFNCGGPGCPVVGFLHQVGTLLFSDDVRARFDLVGFDPRGIGESGGLDCRVDWDAYYALDPSPDDEAERAAWLAGGRDYAAACAANGGALLPFLGTERVVGDMERLRLALGEEKLSYLGLSYGTSLGARYADRYPAHVRAFALDSALPAFVDLPAFMAEWVDGIERSFDGFLADCAAAVTCPLYAGGDPGAAFDALMTELDAQPLTVASDGGTRQVGQHAVLDAVDAMLSSPTRWPSLASALAAAAHGDGAAVLALADEHNERRPDGRYGAGNSTWLAVSCLDFPIAKDAAAFEALTAKAVTVAPRLGAYYMTLVLPCAFWAAPPTPAPHAPVAHGAPPILVVGATLDTQDPYSWSVDLAGQLASGVLLRREGTGHPSYFESACVEEAVTAYLLDLTLPTPGTVCASTGGLMERFG